ncbi:uncharacterized protein LOC130813528 [Amaranthus tricolor]|uniref:uncharacterized protein LOC130813528 n=1 Tax=Amaranthus tricolor TaxID=29722 RepID=UPI0025888BA5|nr:uncharacterized protein LOC130813528 [Amaranthus tricolor]
MTPPAISVDSNFNFNPQSEKNCPSISSTDDCSFSTGCSTSFSSSMGRGSSTRTKPRLVKQRKSSKSFSSATAFGANPFQSVSSQNCSNGNTNRYENLGFVFGAPNSNNNNIKNNSDSKVDDSGDDSCNVAATLFGFRANGKNIDSINNLQREDFSFSSENVMKTQTNKKSSIDGFSDLKYGVNGADFKLVDELEKLNIRNTETIGRNSGEHNGDGLSNGDELKGGERLFVFKTGGKSVRSVIDENVTNLNGNVDGVSDDVFVFGGGGKFSNAGESCCPAENGGARVKEDVLFPSFSFSTFKAEVGNSKPHGCSSSTERKVDCSASCLPNELELPFSEFKLPQFDAPISFSANLTAGLGRKSEFDSRCRGRKDKHVKKAKGKSKPSKLTKLQSVQTPISAEGVTQGQDAPECYSPMDFSPYEDTASSTNVPLSGHHETDQIKETNGISSAVPIETQLNDFGAGISSKMNSHGGDAAQFAFCSVKESRDEEKLKFTSPTASLNHVSSQKRLQRRKYRMKPASISSGASKVRGSSLDGTSHINQKHGTVAGDELGYEAYSAAEKACEKWRRRGNEAYEKGELSKAEDFYTWGVNCVSLGNGSAVAFSPLVRCYSNRAATRMALGRVREAIRDCLMAVELDPSFFRAQIRAANCHLQLGEVEDAIQCFEKCMGSGNVCLDRQLIISASDGIQKAQKVMECTSRCAEVLKQRTSEAAVDALKCIDEAMSISIYSEKLLELRAQALCMLARHEEAIALCQKTLDFAEKNFMAVTPENYEVDESSTDVRMWRYCTLSKCHFHLGNLEAACDLLEKQELRNKTQESSDPLAVTIHELLKQKSAGNAAFRSGKHVEAVEHYTAAIYGSMESRPFAAICVCNRAAAHQAMGQVTDAISDCSLAIALDETYAKAVSRRATLHEMIRDYKQAASDLQRLLSLLQKQSKEKSKQSGSGSGKEIRQVQQRLSMMDEEAKKEIPLDFYLILGTKKSDIVPEIKKAYRKAALKHHPDKAAQSLVKSGENGEEGRHWKDIADLVYKDADRLFKMIGEAYAVLSDPTKREEYDYEEDMRKALKECSNIRTNSRRYSEHRDQGYYPFERSSNRRSWQDSFRTYGHSHRR